MVASHDYVQHILSTLTLAAEANRQTPGRQGCLVDLTPELADEVMVTGDLHGNRRNFNQIRCVAALGENPRRHLVFQEVCHGGPVYPDGGGCMSHTILEDVAAMKAEFPDRVHLILGNHELAELTDYPIQKNRQMLNLLFFRGLKHMYGSAAETVRDAYRQFLRTCPLAMRLPHGVFISHSIPEDTDLGHFDPSVFVQDFPTGPENITALGSVFQLVWGRDYREKNARAFAELVGASVLINGHEPCSEGFIATNDCQLILDCCGQRAAYVILPVETKLSHEQIVDRIQWL
jgi:hypothetical protein